MPSPPRCLAIRAGRVEYCEAWELQRGLVSRVHDGAQPNTLLLLEHPHVYTIGRRGSRDQVLLSDLQLSELGVSLHEADRGGQVTYHGPGQLVVYPVLDLREWGGPLKYVRALEQIMVKTLVDFGVEAGVVEGLTGVWVAGHKIASIGVKISRGVSYHGVAVNVNTDLSYFDHIVPCGIADLDVTSMKRLLGAPVDLDVVAYSLVYHFGREMGFRRVEEDSSLPEPVGSRTSSFDSSSH